MYSEPTEKGRRIWMNDNEYDLVTNWYSNTDYERHIALGMLGSGLRLGEALGVEYRDVMTDNVDKLRIRSSKTGYREVVIGDDLAGNLRAIKSAKSARQTDPVIEQGRRTVQSWVKEIGEELSQNDERRDEWSYLSPHDLRRSWASLLYWDLSHPNSVDIVMELGGWSDRETFEEHYLGPLPSRIEQKVIANSSVYE